MSLRDLLPEQSSELLALQDLIVTAPLAGTQVQAEPPPPPVPLPVPLPMPLLVLGREVGPPPAVPPPDPPPEKAALMRRPFVPPLRGAWVHSSPLKPKPAGNPHIPTVVLGGMIKSIEPSKLPHQLMDTEFISVSATTSQSLQPELQSITTAPSSGQAMQASGATSWPLKAASIRRAMSFIRSIVSWLFMSMKPGTCEVSPNSPWVSLLSNRGSTTASSAVEIGPWQLWV